MGRRPKNQSIQPPTVLAKILADLRRQHKLTMQEFASRLNVSAAYICRLEAGERRPSRDFITHLALTFYPEGSGPEQDELLVAAGYTPLHFRRFIGRDDVIHVFERAIERDPENFKQFIELVLILIKSGRFEQAQQRIQQGMNFYDDQVRLQVLVAATELAKGNFELALQYQNEALKYFLLEADPTKLHLKQQDLHHTLGVTHFMKGYRHVDRYLMQESVTPLAQQERQLAITHLVSARDQFAQALALDAEDVYTLDEYARTFFNLAYLEGENDPNLWKETI
jgi:transcriptional regulator with XRE-family HTH domain